MKVKKTESAVFYLSFEVLATLLGNIARPLSFPRGPRSIYRPYLPSALTDSGARFTMEAFIIEAFTLLGVALVVVGMRTYVRLTTVGIKGFQADDYLMLVAAVSLFFLEM